MQLLESTVVDPIDNKPLILMSDRQKVYFIGL